MPDSFNLSVANLYILSYTYAASICAGGDSVRILVINGSPKGEKSNTWKLSTAFLNGINQEITEPETEILSLRDLQIKPCVGCFSCWSKTPGKCCIRDDMDTVLEKYLWEDLIIWSFPLYYFSVPGGLKNLIDRQLPMVLPFMTDAENGGHPTRYDMSGKRHVVISTCGFHTAKGNYDGVTAMFDHMLGRGNYTSIFCGQGELFRVPELNQQTGEYLNTVTLAGKEFASGSISSATQSKLEIPLFPRDVFERMADASWGIEKNGEHSDESLIFTRQMAALYNPSAWSGKDLILEMYYTDLEKRYQIILNEKGSQVITEDFTTASTTIETTYTLWKSIAAGDISGEEALMQQKYRVKGDFDLMTHWDRYFGSQQPEKTPDNAPKSTNMSILLIPWIAFWTGVSIDSFWGTLISIGSCALVPLVFYRNRKTFYDILSSLFVTSCSLMLILDISLQIVLPLSHLCFGIMWTATCFRKIPLTAHYSVNDYGDQMMNNPLFLKTNRILTACWGVLYLISPIWTYIILGNESLSGWIVLNSILPMLLGIFTGWFQKWYPAKVARGS